MSVQGRKIYDSDFKRNAVRLSEEPGACVTKVADDLGISRDLLYRWRSDFKRKGQLAFPGHGKEALTLEERRIRQLEKRLHEAELERDILKKAVAIFSKAPK